MKKAIIFDAYGTLISTGNGSVTAAGEILKKINVDMDPKVFYKKWKEFHKKQMNEMTEFVTEEVVFENDLKMLYEFYNLKGNYKEDIKIMLDTLDKRSAFDETNEVLNKLSKKYKIYIGSTTDTEPLMANMKNNNIKVDGIYTSESLKEYKPHKSFYTKILDDIKLKAEDVVFVGDSLSEDVKGPQSVGIYSVLLDRKGKYTEEEKNVADAVITDLTGLFEIMEQLS